MLSDRFLARISAELDAQTKVLSFTHHEGGELSIGERAFQAPPFYRAELILKPGAGSFIRVEVWLPDEWNNLFVGTGNGGMAGLIRHDALAFYLNGHYAVANTDMGTSRGENSGVGNPDVWKDFGWRATHLMTKAAKLLIEEHYREKERVSYFVGCSTGGQQALSEAQRFPEDYDGILAGKPANNRVFLHTYFLWNHKKLYQKGRSPLFSPDTISAITRCGAEFFRFRGNTVPEDPFVTYPAADDATIGAFLDDIRQPLHLSGAQLDALREIYRGPVNPVSRRRIYNGMPIGSEMFGCGIADCQLAESPHFYPFRWAFGADYDGAAFDFDKDLERLHTLLSEDLNANSPDLNKFQSRGGKIILLSGTADPCVPFADAKHYYERALQAMGGYEKVHPFFRFFLIPGADHGGGGLGAAGLRTEKGGSLPDEENTEFLALRRWVEEGKAPDRLIAYGYHKETGREFTRYVYPFPGQTLYIGGDPDSAESFTQTNGGFPLTPACDPAYLL